MPEGDTDTIKVTYTLLVLLIITEEKETLTLFTLFTVAFPFYIYCTVGVSLCYKTQYCHLHTILRRQLVTSAGYFTKL